MSGHRYTWFRWLAELTVAKDFNEDVQRSLAEALALAAPQGPKNFPCQDRLDEGGVCEIHKE